MNKTIKELYYGEFIPSEDVYVKDEDYQEAFEVFNKRVEELIDVLSANKIQNAQKLVDDLIDAYTEVQQVECVNAFEYGIKLGLALK